MSLQHGGVECRRRETERQGDRFALGPQPARCRVPQSDPCRNAEDFHAASTLNQMGHSSCSRPAPGPGRRRRPRVPTTRQAARRPSEITSPARHFGTAALDEVLSPLVYPADRPDPSRAVKSKD